METKPQLLVIVPFTIPASGKSELLKTLEFKKYNFNIISSDQIRKQLMDKIKEKQPHLNHHQAFDKSNQSNNYEFKQQLYNLFQKIKNQKTKQNILFIDKNNAPNNLKKLIHIINEHRDQFKIKIVALVPKINQQFYDGKYRYPFSLQYLANCINRAINRQQHQTLIGSISRRIFIVISFFKLYKNFQMSLYKLKKLGFQEKIEVSLTNEDIMLSEQTKQLLVQIIKQTKPFKNEHKLNAILSEKLKEINFKQINKEEIIQQVKEYINKIFE